MINDSIIQSKRPSVVTKKYFLSWIVVAELLCFMKRLRDKVNNDDVSAKYWRQGSEWPRRPPTLSGASDTYSWTIFIYVVPVSLLLFLGILLHVNNGNTKKKLWNILTVNCKSTRTTSVTSYLRLFYQFWTYFTHCYGISTAGWHWTSKYRLGKALIPDLKHEFGC